MVKFDVFAANLLILPYWCRLHVQFGSHRYPALWCRDAVGKCNTIEQLHIVVHWVSCFDRIGDVFWRVGMYPSCSLLKEGYDVQVEKLAPGCEPQY